MRAAGRLLLACIPAVRPLYDPERRRPCPADVTLKTAAFPHDSYSMTRAGMCFRPTVQDRAGPILIHMPAIKHAFGTPAPGGRDNQIRRPQEFRFVSHQLLQVASSALDLKMRKVGLQALGQRLRFLTANRRSTQRMPPDIWPTQGITINQNYAAHARLSKRTGDWRADRSTTEHNNGGI